jgi:hypothetical protein
VRRKIFVGNVFEEAVAISDSFCSQTDPGAGCSRLQAHHVILGRHQSSERRNNFWKILTVLRKETSSCSGATSASAMADVVSQNFAQRISNKFVDGFVLGMRAELFRDEASGRV